MHGHSPKNRCARAVQHAAWVERSTNHDITPRSLLINNCFTLLNAERDDKLFVEFEEADT
jgi:hypothetical protein